MGGKVDQRGDPVPYLKKAPEYTHENARLEKLPRSDPRLVLRSPPSTERPIGRLGVGCGGGGSASSGAWVGARYATDQGCIYFRVFAGITGTIAVPLDCSLFGQEEPMIDLFGQ